MLTYPMARKITQPIKEMTELSKNISKGIYGKSLRIQSNDETGDLAQSMNSMALSLKDKIAQLSEDKSHLSAILTGMAEGVLVLNQQGNILLTNTAMENMFELRHSDIRGRPFIEVIRHHRLNEFIKSTLETGTNGSEEIILQNPEERIFSVQASTIKDVSARDPVGAVYVFHDVTPLKHLEKVRKDFVANVSHELRTPLASIKGYIEALQDGAKDDPKQCSQFLGILEKHTDRLNNIISDLLVLSQIESGQYQLIHEEIHVPELLEKAVSVLQPLADHKHQTLIIKIIEPMRPMMGDLEKMILVIINLLDNAVKYSPTEREIILKACSNKDGVEISITDLGLGISQKEIPRIFERFYRVNRTHSRNVGGTGLGLSIVKHIVEAHGGTLSVQSLPEEGSTFTFTIPSAKDNTPQ